MDKAVMNILLGGEMRFFLTVVCLFLGACSSPYPKYQEPDPKLAETAQLRVVVFAGVNARVTIHADNGGCLDYGSGKDLPIHTNVSGFFNKSDKKIGMPATSSLAKNIGSEMYIPAEKLVNLSAVYRGGNGLLSATCHRALRFYAKRKSNYELYIFAGASVKETVCNMDLYELPENVTEGMTLTPMKVDPVVVQGSPLWEGMCKSSK